MIQIVQRINDGTNIASYTKIRMQTQMMLQMTNDDTLMQMMKKMMQTMIQIVQKVMQITQTMMRTIQVMSQTVKILQMIQMI